MADKSRAPEKPAEPAPLPPARKLPIKALAIVAVLMGVEAGAVVFAMGLLGPSASQAGAETHELVEDDSEETIEIEVGSDKYQNLSTGRVWVWDLSVFMQVKNKNAESVFPKLPSEGVLLTDPCLPHNSPDKMRAKHRPSIIPCIIPKTVSTRTSLFHTYPSPRP